MHIFEKKGLETPIHLHNQTAEQQTSHVGRLTKLHGAKDSWTPTQSCAIAAVLSSGSSLVRAPVLAIVDIGKP